MQKILILYTNYGTGHYMAAQAIWQYIENNYKDVEIFLMDPLSFGRPKVNKLFGTVGKLMATRFRRLRGKIYQKKMYQNYFKDSWFYDFCVMLFFSRKLKREMLKIDPDLIISTQVGPTGIIAKHRDLFKAKLVSVLTDYGIHRMFTVAHEYVDLFCVPTEELKKEMVNLGIDEKKITVTGIPVHSKYLKKCSVSKEDILKRYGLSNERPTFLFVCGGGNGYANALKYFKYLLKSSLDFNYIFIAGKNNKLWKSAYKLSTSSDKYGVTLKYVDCMEELLSASDLVFGKPGGLITSEALSMYTPFVAIEPIPGQEVLNAKFINDFGFGKSINNKDEFNEFLNQLKDPKIINKYKSNIKKNFSKFKFIDIKK